MSEPPVPIDDSTGLLNNRFVTSVNELRLIELLRKGDESTFAALVEMYYTSMVRIAALYVPDSATAEDVVQETWVAVLHGLERFEGRSSLKTWIFTILINRAKTRGQREQRHTAPMVSFDHEDETLEPTVPRSRFRPDSDPKWPHHWLSDSKPISWEGVPEERLLSQETQRLVLEAIHGLPAAQQEVIRLRDVEGWSSSEVCNVLEISETNQRVLLHRARARVRRALEEYFAG